MLGLRTQESTNFNNFFDIVQKEAQRKNCIFFFDTQESVEQTIGNCECMNMSGWLIPSTMANDFLKPFERFENLDKWERFEAWVSWTNKQNKISVTIDLI